MRSTSGLSASAWPTRSPGPEDEVDDARGDAGLLEQPVRWMVVSGVTWAGFMTAVLPAASAGAIFQLIWSSG